VRSGVIKRGFKATQGPTYHPAGWLTLQTHILASPITELGKHVVLLRALHPSRLVHKRRSGPNFALLIHLHQLIGSGQMASGRFLLPSLSED